MNELIWGGFSVGLKMQKKRFALLTKSGYQSGTRVNKVDWGRHQSGLGE
jgi:hypothetical protein